MAEAVEVVLWIFGAVIGALGLVLGFLANWHHKTADRVSGVERDLADFRARVAETYAGHPDIRRVEEAISSVRAELNTVATEMRSGLANVAEKLNQLIGQSHRG